MSVENIIQEVGVYSAILLGACYLIYLLLKKILSMFNKIFEQMLSDTKRVVETNAELVEIVKSTIPGIQSDVKELREDTKVILKKLEVAKYD